jgi:hypothetical protein
MEGLFDIELFWGDWVDGLYGWFRGSWFISGDGDFVSDGVDTWGDAEDGEEIVISIGFGGSNIFGRELGRGYEMFGFRFRNFLEYLGGDLSVIWEAFLDDTLTCEGFVESVNLDGVEAFWHIEAKMENKEFAGLVEFDEIVVDRAVEIEVIERIEGFGVEAGGCGARMNKAKLNILEIAVAIGWGLGYSVEELIVLRFCIGNGDDSFEGHWGSIQVKLFRRYGVEGFVGIFLFGRGFLGFGRFFLFFVVSGGS